LSYTEPTEADALTDITGLPDTRAIFDGLRPGHRHGLHRCGACLGRPLGGLRCPRSCELRPAGRRWTAGPINALQ